MGVTLAVVLGHPIVRIVKLLLAVVGLVLALTVGLVFVAVIAGAIGLYWLARWAQRRLGRSPTAPISRARSRAAAKGDVIDVSATEVRERQERLE